MCIACVSTKISISLIVLLFNYSNIANHYISVAELSTLILSHNLW